ncbi:hypothetical protein MTO96_007433 [Rhipicephalus appendiculatus]
MATAAGVNGTVARFRFGIRDFSRLMNPRPTGNEPYVPTELEHVANIITHALSILPSFFALKFLLQRAHTPAHLTAAVVYGIALVVLFVTSSLFHSVHFLGKLRTLKVILHRCDRAAIYIFIASAYTPWLMLREYSSWGQKQLYVVWFLCLLGITYQNIFHERYKTLEVLIYIGSAVFPCFRYIFDATSDGPQGAAVRRPTLLHRRGVLQVRRPGAVRARHLAFVRERGHAGALPRRVPVPLQVGPGLILAQGAVDSSLDHGLEFYQDYSFLCRPNAAYV